MKTYDEYIEVKSQLEYYKQREKELRIKICDKVLEGQPTGTHRLTKGIYNLKAVKKVNYKIDNDLLTEVWDDLTEEEQAAVKYTPELRLTQYKQLEDSEGIDQVITVTPAMPELTIEKKEVRK